MNTDACCCKFRLVKDIKVIPDEKCVTQHRLQVFELNLKIKENVKKSYVPKLRTQKLKDSDINEVSVKSSSDTFENYRFSATLILLMIYGKISRVLSYQTQKNYVYSQRKTSRGNIRGGRINPEMV